MNSQSSCVRYFEGNLSKAIDQSRQEANAPLVFLHIPKTAGTSAQRDLNFAYPNGVHVPFDAPAEKWQKILDQVQQAHPPIVRGQLNFQHVADLRAINPAFRAVTYLRHPLERLVSFYLWQLSLHRANPDRYNDPGEFEGYCERRASRSMTSTLVGPVRSGDEAIEKMIEQFWFVGLTEFYHLCQSVLFESLNFKYRLRPRHNITRSTSEDRQQVTPAGLEIAKSLMDVDFAVYNYFHLGWAKQVNEAVELILQSKQGSRPSRQTLSSNHQDESIERVA